MQVQPGVTNLAITKAVEHAGFYYAPDPSSQIACSIGGNVGENSGGVHCLKYGLTTNNLLGLEIVLMDGSVLRLGGKYLDSDLYDLIGVMTGSEGLLGVITEVTVRILQKPETARALLVGLSIDRERRRLCRRDHCRRVSYPGGLEMMDHLAANAAEDFQACGYPRDVEALIVCELDGTGSEVDHLMNRVSQIAKDMGRQLQSRLRKMKSSGCSSGRAAKMPFRPLVPLDPTICAWMAPYRAAQLSFCSWLDQEAVKKIWLALRQCLSCRGRQSAPAYSL